MDKKSPEYWKNTGNEFYGRGRFTIALRCYVRAIKLDPDYIDAWNNLGFTYQKLGKIEEAKRCNEQVKKLKGNSGQ